MNNLPTDQEINYILNETQKYKTITKELKKTLEEPILLMIRNDGNIDVFEGIKANEYNFEHSDGTQRTILLTKSPLKIKRGKERIRCHIVDENNGTAYPMTPLIDTLSLKNHMDNVLEAQKKLDIQLEQEKNQRLIYWVLGIALILLVLFLFGRPLLEFLFQNKEVVTPAVQGGTTIIGG